MKVVYVWVKGNIHRFAVIVVGLGIFVVYYWSLKLSSYLANIIMHLGNVLYSWL